MGGLQYMGLPLPHDDQGAILRYKTDHDLPVDLTPEVQREFFEKGWGSYLIKEG